MVVTLLSEHTGHTPEEMHEDPQGALHSEEAGAGESERRDRGELVIGGTTTKLDVVQFYEFVQEIKQWALTASAC